MKLLFCITTTVVEALAPTRAFTSNDRELIDFARLKCDLHAQAGIEELSCYHPETDETECWPARDWDDGEELATAIQVFRESGTFLTFDATDPQDRLRFVLEADAHGCGKQARKCLEEIAA